MFFPSYVLVDVGDVGIHSLSTSPCSSGSDSASCLLCLLMVVELRVIQFYHFQQNKSVNSNLICQSLHMLLAGDEAGSTGWFVETH